MGAIPDLAFTSVIFGTDFSESGHAAGRYAALFARHYNADFIIAHAFTLVQPALEVETLEHAPSAQRMDLERLLAETARELAPSAGRTTTLLGEGSPMELIRVASEERGPCLVVLGTHGAGALERHIIGSVAEHILRTIRSPVLTVGSHVALPASDVLPFRRVLYATDFSLAAVHAAPYAVALARATGSELDVVHVVPDDAIGRPDFLTEHEQEFLGALKGILPDGGDALGRSRQFVEHGTVREAILRHAEEGGVDLIVLGAHHHSRLARLFRTGPAFQIILAAACPVLTICRS